MTRLIDKEIEAQRRFPKVKLNELVIPIEKVTPIVRFALKKQYPKKTFTAVRVENWQQGKLRWQNLFGVES